MLIFVQLYYNGLVGKSILYRHFLHDIRSGAHCAPQQKTNTLTQDPFLLALY